MGYPNNQATSACGKICKWVDHVLLMLSEKKPKILSLYFGSQ